MTDDGRTVTELGGQGRIRRLPRSVAYIFVVAIFGGVYGAIVYVLGSRWGVRTLAGSVQIFAAAFLLSLAVGIPIHVRVQSAVDRWLTARRRTASTLHALFARLTTGTPVGDLVRRALAIVRQDLGLTAASLLLLAPERGGFLSVATIGTKSAKHELPDDHPLTGIVRTLLTEISRRSLAHNRYARVRAECLAAFDRLEADMLFPIEVEGRLVGLLALAGPNQMQRLKPAESEVLRALSAELAVCAARAQDEERIRTARLELERFVRYLPRSVAKDVLGSGLPGEHGRRRVVTAVSCQVRGFDALAEIAEPGALGDAVARYHALAAAEARREGGTFAYAHGERVTVVFGDPEPHRDHAGRALRMASRLVTEGRQLWEPWRADVPALDVQVGVATGQALVGFIAVGSEIDYQVIGDPKEIADELRTLASGGDILLTTATSAVADAGTEVEPTTVTASPTRAGSVCRLVALPVAS